MKALFFPFHSATGIPRQKRTAYPRPFVLLLAFLSSFLLLTLFSCTSKSYEDHAPRDAKALLRLPPQAIGRLLSLFHTDTLPQGLDSGAPLYAFISGEGHFGLLLPVDDEQALTRSLETRDDVTALLPGEDFSSATWREQWLLTWNDKALVLLGPGGGSVRRELQREAGLMFRAPEGMTASPLYALLPRGGDAQTAWTLEAVPQPWRAALTLSLPKEQKSSALCLRGEVTLSPKGWRLESTVTTLAGASVPPAARRLKGTFALETEGDIAGCLFAMSGEELLREIQSSPLLRPRLLALDEKVDIHALLPLLSGDLLLRLTGLNAHGGVNVELRAQALPELERKWPHMLRHGVKTTHREGFTLFALNGDTLALKVAGGEMLLRWGDFSVSRPAATKEERTETKGKACQALLNLPKASAADETAQPAEALLSTLSSLLLGARYESEDGIHATLRLYPRKP